jgi:hypothetical protein
VNRGEIRAMLAALPPGVTPAERLLLAVVALHADDRTGIGWPGEGLLEAETGLSARGLQDALARLARRGLEVRLPLVTGAAGRGAYSVTGRRRRFRVPEKLLGVTAGQDNRSRQGVTTGPPPGQTGEPAGQDDWSRPDVTTSPPPAQTHNRRSGRLVTPGRDHLVTPQRDLKVEKQKPEYRGDTPLAPPQGQGQGQDPGGNTGSPQTPSSLIESKNQGLDEGSAARTRDTAVTRARARGAGSELAGRDGSGPAGTDKQDQGQGQHRGRGRRPTTEASSAAAAAAAELQRRAADQEDGHDPAGAGDADLGAALRASIRERRAATLRRSGAEVGRSVELADAARAEADE